jgi:alkylation response protein AidB-like acyl-CoA dehydrogenase
MPDITAGRKITAGGHDRADAGSDLASMRTNARKVDGGYRLNGAKMFITNGVHGDLYFVAAKTGEGRPQPSHHHVRRREGRTRLPRRPRAEEDRLAVQRHRRAGVRRLFRSR